MIKKNHIQQKERTKRRIGSSTTVKPVDMDWLKNKDYLDKNFVLSHQDIFREDAINFFVRMDKKVLYNDYNFELYIPIKMSPVLKEINDNRDTVSHCFVYVYIKTETGLYVPVIADKDMDIEENERLSKDVINELICYLNLMRPVIYDNMKSGGLFLDEIKRNNALIPNNMISDLRSELAASRCIYIKQYLNNEFIIYYQDYFRNRDYRLWLISDMRTAGDVRVRAKYDYNNYHYEMFCKKLESFVKYNINDLKRLTDCSDEEADEIIAKFR